MSILSTPGRRDRAGGRDRAGDRDQPPRGRAAAEAAVTALYHEHALGLTRLAHVMLGDRAAAEDVVQEAFAGLFRRWMFLNDTAKAPAYLRSAVLNGCRTVARRGVPPVLVDAAAVDGADVALLAAEERRAVLATRRELPGRQREALVLGVPPYYAALSTTGTPALSHPMNVAVRDTATGEPLATVTPPAGLGTFTFVAGGAVDDRTWVVGAQPWKPQRIGNQLFYGLQPLTFFLLTFEPQDRVIRLEQLPGFTVTAPPGLPGAGTAQPVVGIEAAALSPDGSRLAVATSEGSAAKMLVHITPVAPGAHGGTWVLPGRLAQGDMRNPVLSRTADNRVLSVATWKDLIFLDPAKPSGDLLSASRVVPFTGQAPTGITYACTNSAVMSLDGTTMTCGGSPSTDGYKLQSIGIITISARTGMPLHYLPIRRYGAWVTGPSVDLYWASPTEAGTYIALPWDFRQLPKAPASLTVWRHGKVAGTIPFARDIAPLLLPYRGRSYVSW